MNSFNLMVCMIRIANEADNERKSVVTRTYAAADVSHIFIDEDTVILTDTDDADTIRKDYPNAKLFK
jgi:hypothetical protein